MQRVAILIDGGFFLKRYRTIYGQKTASEVADDLYKLATAHAKKHILYRVFYYDAKPLDKKFHNPVSKKSVDLSKSPEAVFRKSLFEELKKKRKLALRLGYISEIQNWIIKPSQVKSLLEKKITIDDLTDQDIMLDLKQKGVDIRIGLDISSLAYKKHVDKIVLISGDGDFVPAAKLARREGIDVILDPMWNNINAELFEHIDGLKSTCKKPH
jgi:uncharacterized LabA/DUF88 family protein